MGKRNGNDQDVMYRIVEEKSRYGVEDTGLALWEKFKAGKAHRFIFFVEDLSGEAILTNQYDDLLDPIFTAKVAQSLMDGALQRMESQNGRDIET